MHATCEQNGPGRKMQRYLVLKSWWAANYVTDWWESYVYLHGRSSLMINSNYYACVRHYYEHTCITCMYMHVQDVVGNHKLTTNALARAGQLTHIFMRLKREIERGQIKPLLIMDIVPLCSAQYERMFGTTRVAGLEADRLVHYSGAESDHCVCYRKGKWFKVPLASPGGKLYSSVEMEHQFQLVQEAGESGEKAGEGEISLPALTALGRTEWAEARLQYFEEGVNKASITVIEKVSTCHHMTVSTLLFHRLLFS